MAMYFWCDEFENDKLESDKFILYFLTVIVCKLSLLLALNLAMLTLALQFLLKQVLL